jgi:Glycosyltransferase family 87
MPLSDRGRRFLVLGFAVVGYGFLARVLIVNGIQDAGGLGGIDAIAYWTAAGHALRGEPIYGIASFQYAAYQYPPPFAQVLAPAALLPMPVFVWLWRGVELLGLRMATGSWTWAGIAILVFPPVIAELDAGNVHLVIAGVVALAMRGGGLPVGPAFLLKLSTWPLVPGLWFRRWRGDRQAGPDTEPGARLTMPKPIGDSDEDRSLRRQRRGLIGGAAIAVALVGISIAVTPGAWQDYITFLRSGSLPTGAYNVLAFMPLSIRLALAAGLAVAAVRWIRLAPVAVTLAYPVVWFHALSTLTAVVRPLRAPAGGGPVVWRGPIEPRRSTPR